jgi:hypothetical protein
MGAVVGIVKWGFIVLFAACLVLTALHPWPAAFLIGVHPYPAGTPWTYQLWSGFIPSLAIASLLGGIITHFRTLSCHVHRCWRFGKFLMAGGQFKVCHKHSGHPEKITHEYVLAQHEEHLRCAAPPSLP